MSTAVAQILREVEQLSDRERMELRRALLEQVQDCLMHWLGLRGQ
jgi:hypothetical protein